MILKRLFVSKIIITIKISYLRKSKKDKTFVMPEIPDMALVAKFMLKYTEITCVYKKYQEIIFTPIIRI